MQTVAPVRREVVVPVGRQTAFRVFTARMTDWWPEHQHIGEAPIAEVVVEPREGGRWFTKHEDGSETSTGFVLTWDPPAQLVLTWQVSAEWRYEPGLLTTVQVDFEEDTEGRTRVTLEHRDLERFGPQAEKMREMFEAPDAWQGTLESFAGAFAESRS